MKKMIVLFSLICLNFFFVNLQEAKSKVKVGYEFFDRALEVVTKKVLNELNNKRNNLPDMNLSFDLIKFIPVNVILKNFTFSEIPFIEKQFSINHVTGDTISVRLSNIL